MPSFFHIVINAILQDSLGIKNFGPNHSLDCQTGVLGCIEGYIGTVEAQGRGTLHLHMVLWLTDSLTALQMKEYLQSEQFRERLKTFISTNICANLQDIVGEAVLAIPKDSAVAFSRPVNPRKSDYICKSHDAENHIARTVQIHQCNRGCMRLTNGHWVCK